MKPALSIAGPWPRLSDDLPLNHPQECAQCGVGKDLQVWQEHDTADNPEPVFIVLCQRCSGAIIEPHERHYRCLAPNEPAPGVMPICLNCAHRAGSCCFHPRSRFRKGPGLKLEQPSPMTSMVDYAGKHGRREGGRMTFYPGVVYGCAGKELEPVFTTL